IPFRQYLKLLSSQTTGVSKMNIRKFKYLICGMFLAIASPYSLADEHPAQVMVEEAITGMLDLFQTEEDRLKSDPEFLQSKLDELIVPHLDFDLMTKSVVKKYWRKATDSQRDELVIQFKALLMNAYSGALTEYSGESITFEPFRPASREDRAVVKSVFSQKTGEDVPVVYKLRDKSGWTIYDIEVNNISLVTSYRSAFYQEIEKGGIEGLIATLKERNGTS
nr:ABC transporter substrate-binding protein [Granulosicoccus sp.]